MADARRPEGTAPADADVSVFVEIPRGSRNKYEYDEAAGGIVLDRMLFTAMQYPTDYGFVEETVAEDGDPLDAMVFVGEPTFPGCRIRARVVGVFKMRDEEGNDVKILCIPLRDPNWSSVQSVDDIPEGLRNEIQHFFSVYKDLEQKATEIEGWGDREEALAFVEAARSRQRTTQ